MLGNKPTPLRSALLNLKIQPTLLSPSIVASTLTPSFRRLSLCSHYSIVSKSSDCRPNLPISSSHPQESQRPKNLHTTRSLSQTPSSTDPSTPFPPPSTSTTTNQPTPLTWNAYLALRKTRRHYNLFFSPITSLSTTALGASYLSQQSLDSIAVFSLDPLVVLGITMTACMGAGWLMGPFMGNALFKFRYRQQWGEIAEKEKDLFRRIKKNRVDPSGGSTANPVPDYYGEKIDSVRGYRHWMKDQRAFNKKRQNFL